MYDALISESDAQSMAHLLGATAALEGGHAEKKRFLMNGLCRLIRADSWVWTLGYRNILRDEQVHICLMDGGFTRARCSSLIKALEHPVMGMVAKPLYQACATDLKQTTLLLDESALSCFAYASDLKAYFEAADIGSLVLSGQPFDEGSLSLVAIYRQFDDVIFTERETALLHIVLEEVPWLHLLGWPEENGTALSSLSPRQNMVFKLMLDGLGRKQISASLGIAENTVAGYARDLYRHFGVNSQAELMHKYLSGRS